MSDTFTTMEKSIRLRLAILAVRLIRHVAPSTVSRAFSECVKELLVHRKHLAAVRRSQLLAANGGHLKLELGGGVNSKPGWVNVDLRTKDGLTLDLRRPLPFPDGSVDAIRTEHLLECLVYPADLMHLLSECYRVLRVGGIFSAGVPDAGRAFKAYAAGPGAFYCDKYWANVRPRFVNSPMDELNWLIYMGGTHHYMFDEQNLRLRLEEASFVDVRQRGPNPTTDNAYRQNQSIYVEAKKGGSETQLAQEDIRTRHTKEIVDQFASHAALAPIIAKLRTIDRYAILRLAMLVAGEQGNTLVLGTSALPILKILNLFKTLSGTQTFGIVKPPFDDSSYTRELKDRIKLASYPPLPFTDGYFRRVVTITTTNGLILDRHMLQDIGRVLTTEKDGRIYAVLPADVDLEVPSPFVCFHKERLPVGAGVLFVLRRALQQPGKTP